MDKNEFLTMKEVVAAFRKKYDDRYPTVYAAQAYDVVMAMDAAVRAVGGKVSDREAVLAALKKADFKSVRGEFRFGNNQYPIQDYYLRTIGRDTQGRITNRTLNKVFTAHQDIYAGQCPMK